LVFFWKKQKFSYKISQSHIWCNKLLRKENYKMEIPITGYMYDSEDSGSGHTHSLFIKTWDGRPYDGKPLHVHPFKGITSFDAGHRHKYAGKTEPAPSGIPHTHRYFAVTTFDDGHTHVLKGRTGADIPVPGGGHIHYFEGVTTVDGDPPHTHIYKGETGR
jgi:hypothetical protein